MSITTTKLRLFPKPTGNPLLLADEVVESSVVVRDKGVEFVGSSEPWNPGTNSEIPGTGDSDGREKDFSGMGNSDGGGRNFSGMGDSDGEGMEISGAIEGTGLIPYTTGGEVTGAEAVGDSAGDSAGDPTGTADEPASVSTASFIPAEQWPGIEQMKYLFPGEVRVITAKPPP